MSPADVILMLLLSAQTPGRSPHAKIFLESCDIDCQATPRCEQPLLHCRPPQWSRRREQFYRFESWTEGVQRYHQIAEVVADTARDMTWQQHPTCQAPGHGSSAGLLGVDGRCDAAHRARPWTGSERQLERLLVTVFLHESALRRDVHAGTTRGDCDYSEAGGGRRLIEGSCRSHCLGQVQILRGQRTRRGYDRDDIVGIDRAATRRCVETVIDRLSGAHDACVAQHQGNASASGARPAAYPACTMGLYGGVGSWGSDPRIAARSKTYRTLSARAASYSELPPEVREALQR